MSPPVLALPKPNLPYALDTKANAAQIGAVLLQKQEDDVFKCLGYFSKTLTSNERNYDSIER